MKPGAPQPHHAMITDDYRRPNARPALMAVKHPESMVGRDFKGCVVGLGGPGFKLSCDPEDRNGV